MPDLFHFFLGQCVLLMFRAAGSSCHVSELQKLPGTARHIRARWNIHQFPVSHLEQGGISII